LALDSLSTSLQFTDRIIQLDVIFTVCWQAYRDISEEIAAPNGKGCDYSSD
jgi:hypothetical protein